MTLSQRAELNTLRERYKADLKPDGPDQELAVEQVARAAWAIRLLERQEAEIFAAYVNPFMNPTARRSLMGVSKLRSHYGEAFHASLRFFLSLASRDARQKRAAAKTSPEKRTR